MMLAKPLPTPAPARFTGMLGVVAGLAVPGAVQTFSTGS